MTRLGVRSRINRTLLLVFTLALAAGVALTAVALVRSVRKLNRYATAEGFLRDLKDGRFAHAYQRLCSQEPMESEASFVSRLQRASASGRGLRSYEYTIPFDPGVVVGAHCPRHGDLRRPQQRRYHRRTCPPPFGYLRSRAGGSTPSWDRSVSAATPRRACRSPGIGGSSAWRCGRSSRRGRRRGLLESVA